MRAAARLFAAAMLMLPASQAAALSCIAYDIREAFWRHADAPDTYLLAHGRFSELRDPFHDTQNDQVIWQATFVGNSASRRAFDQPFSAEVTITNRLFTGIAGGESTPDGLAQGLPGLEGLVFLRETLGGYVIETALCEPVIDTDPANVPRALDCLNGHRCARPN
jgi:hypothetical protein